MIAAADIADLPGFPDRGVPELDVVGEGEPGRRHANHDVGVAVERNLRPRDVGIRREIAFPCAVGQNDDLGRRSRVFARRKRSPDLCAGTQRRKKVGAHPSRVDAERGTLGAKQVETQRTLDRDDRCEAVRLVPEVHQILRREHLRRLAGIRPMQVQESVRSLEAKGLEEHAVHKAERRGAGADRERHGGERDQCERGGAHQSARGVSEFLDGGFHILWTVRGAAGFEGRG